MEHCCVAACACCAQLVRPSPVRVDSLSPSERRSMPSPSHPSSRHLRRLRPPAAGRSAEWVSAFSARHFSCLTRSALRSPLDAQGKMGHTGAWRERQCAETARVLVA
eukprot:scaffold230407_cov30-Tisochrysis_lutea.AAC.2